MRVKIKRGQTSQKRRLESMEKKGSLRMRKDLPRPTISPMNIFPTP